jgi:hypothetical protein
MAQMRAYLGPAGSGKTYALMEEVKRISGTTSFHPTQAILAITFMHGSRRRLAERLRAFAKKGFPTQCDTIDSFCLQIVNRFRRYLGKPKPISIRPSLGEDKWQEGDRHWQTTFTVIRRAAIELLGKTSVRSAIASAYPIILVDEFQDCEGELLELIGLLSIESELLLAADEFQHLSSDEVCPARTWLDTVGCEIIPMVRNRRTSNNVLLETASAIREGSSAVRSIEVHLVPSGIAAYEISSHFTWGKIPFGKSKVLISPVRPESSSWFQGILDSLKKELGKKSRVGPCPFTWDGGEQDQFEIASALVCGRCTASEEVNKSFLDEFERVENPIVRMAAKHARRLIGIRGDDAIGTPEFFDILQQTSHSASAFRTERSNSRTAMTVHGAKNREFDFVFIAWPYEAQRELLGRKLLYNAVTRAKEKAILFVQGDMGRMKKDKILALLQSGIVKRDAWPAKSKK